MNRREVNNHAISTHSLTRRLTVVDLAKASEEYISTHSLTRRLTFDAAGMTPAAIFQLTASQGG